MVLDMCRSLGRDGLMRLPKQGLVHDPHVGEIRGLAIPKVFDEEIFRLAGELAQGGWKVAFIAPREVSRSCDRCRI